MGYIREVREYISKTINEKSSVKIITCYNFETQRNFMSEALKLVRKKLVNVIAELAKFADKYKNHNR